MAFIVADECPPRFDGDFLTILGAVMKFAVPFSFTDRPSIAGLKFFLVGVEKLPNILANSFVTSPTVQAFGTLVPKKYLPLKIANQDRVMRLV